MLFVYANNLNNTSSVSINNGIETVTKKVSTSINNDNTINIIVTITSTNNKTGQIITETKNYTV